MSCESAGYRFQIKPADSGWSWAAFDPKGRVCATGAAPTKAIAAAFVIRTIARALSPDQAPVEA